jgi:hypothetical protein
MRSTRKKNYEDREKKARKWVSPVPVNLGNMPVIRRYRFPYIYTEKTFPLFFFFFYVFRAF